jgi:Phage integrase, N-terminal SAM-like domain
MSIDVVSPLRQRMIEDMTARKLGAGTQRLHISSCKRFAAFLQRSPETATVEDVRRFQLHLAETKLLARCRHVLCVRSEHGARKRFVRPEQPEWLARTDRNRLHFDRRPSVSLTARGSPLPPCTIDAFPHRMVSAREVETMAAITRADVDGFSVRGQSCGIGLLSGNASREQRRRGRGGGRLLRRRRSRG